MFSFESNFEPETGRKWMTENWTNGFYYTGIYVILIFGGQYLMKNRPRFELNGALVIWNTLLAAFSIVGACRTLPQFWYFLRNYGLQHSVCDVSFIGIDKVSGFWSFLFALSKLPELGDTVFIVLRKQPLIFLHWYHHITVLLYSWYSYSTFTSSARWFVVMNYCVHSIMYSYYALRAMKFKPPRQIAMVITTLQLLQMVCGCAINIQAYQALQIGAKCNITPLNVKLSIIMYMSYFVLFARFFFKSYISSGKERKQVQENGNSKLKSKAH